jgi:hypothetical protein
LTQKVPFLRAAASHFSLSDKCSAIHARDESKNDCSFSRASVIIIIIIIVTIIITHANNSPSEKNLIYKNF